LNQAIVRAASMCSIAPDMIDVLEYAWLSNEERTIPALPRENSDFAAQVCIAIDVGCADIRRLVHALQQAWITALTEHVGNSSSRNQQQLVQPA
jgi:hypothetical protein